MFEDILMGIKDAAGNISTTEIMGMNPLTLAYIGDAVYEVFIRTSVIAAGPDRSVHKLHVISTGYVKAHAQSDIVRKIMPGLSEEELNIIRRGRNSKSANIPKNADVLEYRNATGFEALIGYLYLSCKNEKLIEILKLSIKEGQQVI